MTRRWAHSSTRCLASRACARCTAFDTDMIHGPHLLSDTFIRNRVLPAVRANVSLRSLALVEREDRARASLLEAEALVYSRADD